MISNTSKTFYTNTYEFSKRENVRSPWVLWQLIFIKKNIKNT